MLVSTLNSGIKAKQLFMHPRLSLLVLATGILWFSNMSTSSADTLLKASVQTSDHPTALDPTLAPGTTFDKGIATTLLKSARDNEWIKIPSWMAGTWSAQDTIVTFSRDEITGREDFENRPFKSESTEVWGYVPSRDGWWEFGDCNYWETNKSDNLDGCYGFVQRFSPVNTGKDEITATFVAIRFTVDPATMQIQDIEQDESIQVYRKLSDNLMQVTGSVRAYDMHGKLLSIRNLAQNQRKIQEPIRVATTSHDGRCIAKLLSKYLATNQKSGELSRVLVAVKSGHFDKTSVACFLSDLSTTLTNAPLKKNLATR